MIGVSVTVDLREVDAMIARLEKRLTTPEGLLSGVAAIMREDVLSQFQQGGDPPWQPLSPITIERKRAMGYPRLSRDGTHPSRMIQNGNFGPENILMRTGTLLSSWTDAKDLHHVEEIDADGVTIGSALPYAGTHQHGYTGLLFGRIEGTIPARPLTITDRAMRRIEQLAIDELSKEND